MKEPLLFSVNGEFEELALQALRDCESGAEWGILERLVSVVLSGKAADPVFQSVANAIVAKAVYSGKFPSQKRGNPTSFMKGAPGGSIADRYLELTDGGMKAADAVERVADEFPKDDGTKLDERHILRLVRKNRPWMENRMGATVEARQEFRADRSRRDDTELSAEGAVCVANVIASMEELGRVLAAHAASRNRREDFDRLIDQALHQK